MLDNLNLRRRRTDRPHRFKRGVYLLPSLFTVANLFCGYACIVYSTQRADFDKAALFIGVAMVLDTFDGFLARLTNSSTAFGVELDSLADVVSFGLAPAILAFAWGLWPLGRLGWAAGFLYVTATAMRLARFNIQSSSPAVMDKRYFVGLPSPAAAAVIASTVFLYPYGLQESEFVLPALAMVLVPALLMVSTVRFRSVKAIDVGWRRSYFALFLGAVAIALVASHPRIALVALSYSYIVFALISWAIGRTRKRHGEPPASTPGPPSTLPADPLNGPTA